MRQVLIILLFCTSALAVNRTVKAGGGGDFTTIQACANAMAAGDTCIVFAGNYAENVTTGSGTTGNYKTFTVNGTDTVTVQHFSSVGSHVKIIGNCPDSVPVTTGVAPTASCGFWVGQPSSPGGTCFSITVNSTDYFIQSNMTYACGPFVSESANGNTSHGYIGHNTFAYASCTATAPNTGRGFTFNGDYHLVEYNDISHASDGAYTFGGHNILRKNKIHDFLTSECGTNSGNCHLDPYQFDAVTPATQPAFDVVLEANSITNFIGGNTHASGLFQGESCSGACSQAIVRFEVANGVGAGALTDDNSGAAPPGWSAVHLYNNSWININNSVNGNGETSDSFAHGSPNGSVINDLFYYTTGTFPDFNPYYFDGTSTPSGYGHNIAYCAQGGATCNLRSHNYGSGAFTDDPGNKKTNPLLVNPSSDFHLQASSPARNAGANLTTVNGSVSNSTTLVVTDAGYFQDGYTLPGVSGDCIAVTSITNKVCITAVNYTTNTLTLASPVTATNGDPVYIYSISDGTQVLTDTTGPDMGAFPFNATPPAPAAALFARGQVTITGQGSTQ